jgi:hypothetical protein
MKKYLMIYHSIKKIKCITILWWVLVVFSVHLTSRLASTFSCTLYRAFTQLYFFFSSQCMLCKLAWNNFTLFTKSQMKVSWFWTYLFKPCRVYNIGIVEVSPKMVSTSHVNSQFVVVDSLIVTSCAIFTKRDLNSSRITLLGAPMLIHLILMIYAKLYNLLCPYF